MILNYLEGVKYYFKFSTIIFDIVTRLCLCYTGAIMKQTLLVAFMAAFLTSNPTVKPDANPSKCNEASDKKSVPSVVILNDSKAAAEAPQHNQEAPKWYRTIEWANWALVFVGVLTGYAVWRQTKQTALAAKATREAADATKDAAKAALLNAKAFINSERPWIIGSPSMPKLERPKDLRVILVYASSVKNIGRTPAKILEIGLACRKSNSLDLIPPIPVYEKREVLFYNKILLIPSDSFTVTTVIEFSDRDFDSLRPQGKGLLLYAHGYIKYMSALGEFHETCFVHYYHIPGPFELQKEGWRLLAEAPEAYYKAT